MGCLQGVRRRAARGRVEGLMALVGPGPLRALWR